MPFDPSLLSLPISHNRNVDTEIVRHEGWLYEAFPDKSVRCHVCAHHCYILEGKLGVCRVRQNIDGTLYTLVYGRTISQHVDPIEKKPLYHFYPGSTAYSIATPGCNFRCKWCQNWSISQMPREQDLILGRKATPQQIVQAAQSEGSQSIAYTYTEPTVFFEYAYDTAALAHETGLKNVFVTNGYMSEEMLSVLQENLDAANVDLKAFKGETYRRYIGAKLQPVLDTMKMMKQLGTWLEVTSLIIPELNDDPSEIRDMAAFVAQELGPDTPWHISRFFPAYKMADRSPTPLKTMIQALEIGLEEGLHYIYIGNVHEDGYNNTKCPNCGKVLIRRSGFSALDNYIEDGRCPHCGAIIPGVGISGS